MRTAYKFRMYPNKQQKALLDVTLETCRHLYNTALADRKNTYEHEGISRSYEDQAAILTIEKKDNPILDLCMLIAFKTFLEGWISPSKHSSAGLRRERIQDILDSKGEVGTSRSHIPMLEQATKLKVQS